MRKKICNRATRATKHKQKNTKTQHKQKPNKQTNKNQTNKTQWDKIPGVNRKIESYLSYSLWDSAAKNTARWYYQCHIVYGDVRILCAEWFFCSNWGRIRFFLLDAAWICPRRSEVKLKITREILVITSQNKYKYTANKLTKTSDSRGGEQKLQCQLMRTGQKKNLEGERTKVKKRKGARVFGCTIAARIITIVAVIVP